MPVVLGKGLSKQYGRIHALENCDFSIPEGSFTALVGANGAGKSTLLLTLVGLLAPSAGEVTVFGLIPHRQRRETIENIGFVAQDRPLYRSLSVRATLTMGKRLNPRWMSDLATERLARLGIPLDREVGRLSGGQQAQVALSLALGKQPRLLILDEPMASLDPLARQLFLDELIGISRSLAVTLILSSHVLAELARVCDHVVILQAGRVKACGTAESIVATAPGRRHPLAGRLTELENSVLEYLRHETVV